MVKTGIFGGSFNPLHCGHIRLAQQVLAAGWVDEVWLLVSPQNPLKRNDALLPEEERLALARKALAGVQGIVASDFEFSLPRPSFTWHTLGALTEAYPQRSFSLIIGADNWTNFHRWAHAREIVDTYNIIVYPREGYPVREESLPPGVRLLHAQRFPFSSTDVRRAAACGEDIGGMVPAVIADDVRRLYGRE